MIYFTIVASYVLYIGRLSNKNLRGLKQTICDRFYCIKSVPLCSRLKRRKKMKASKTENFYREDNMRYLSKGYLIRRLG
mgnify:CR=1 FL=1